MSYDIKLVDRCGKTIQLDKPHHLRGGTYADGGTTEAWLNVTYNYAPHFIRVLGEKGIRTLYGMTGEESMPVLVMAVTAMNDDTEPQSYWAPTEGNARRALLDLMELAHWAPQGIWAGD